MKKFGIGVAVAAIVAGGLALVYKKWGIFGKKNNTTVEEEQDAAAKARRWFFKKEDRKEDETVDTVVKGFTA